MLVVAGRLVLNIHSTNVVLYHHVLVASTLATACISYDCECLKRSQLESQFGEDRKKAAVDTVQLNTTKRSPFQPRS